MFQQLAALLKSPEPKVEPGSDLRLSVAILLLEAAKMDDEFGPDERKTIVRLLTQKFGITEEESTELLTTSEERLAELVQLHPHTHACFSQMDHEERVHLIEMLWEVVYADGALDPHEDLLVRRLARLVHVSDRERVLARQRVLGSRS